MYVPSSTSTIVFSLPDSHTSASPLPFTTFPPLPIFIWSSVNEILLPSAVVPVSVRVAPCTSTPSRSTLLISTDASVVVVVVVVVAEISKASTQNCTSFDAIIIKYPDLANK